MIGRALLVGQGRWARIDAIDATIGTYGLAPCFGLAIRHQSSWIVAHIDCDYEVASRQKEVQERISDWVARQLATVVAADADSVIMASPNSGPVQSSIEIGVRRYFDAGARFVRRNDDGFIIDERQYYAIPSDLVLPPAAESVGATFSSPARRIIAELEQRASDRHAASAAAASQAEPASRAGGGATGTAGTEAEDNG
jgi:hypothetical protein